MRAHFDRSSQMISGPMDQFFQFGSHIFLYFFLFMLIATTPFVTEPKTLRKHVSVYHAYAYDLLGHFDIHS